jgi:hypothetical protein
VEGRDAREGLDLMADCEWIILCDYAFQAVPGKLCLIGIFDTIFATKAPAAHPRAAVGFGLVGEPGESGEAKLEIIGTTGAIIAKTTAGFTLPDAGSAQGLIDIPQLVLPEFGRYAIQIDLGETIPKQAWFTLKQLQT